MSHVAAQRSLTPRERVRAAIEGREPDRVPIYDEVSPEALARWEAEEPGAAGAVAAAQDIHGIDLDLSPRYPVQTVEETAEYRDETTPFGGIRRVFREAWRAPRMMAYAIRSRADWELLRLRLAPEEARAAPATLEAARAAAAAGRYLALRAIGGVTQVLALLGRDALLTLLATDPGWVREMAEAHADLLIGAIGHLLDAGIPLDAVLVRQELADRAGPRIPPWAYAGTFAPADRRVADAAHGRGLKVLVYAPGDLRPLIPALLDAGMDGLGPCQVAAGMDVRTLRINYGADLSFLGGLDVRTLAGPDPDAPEREIARVVRDVMVGGRYVAGFDGPIPPEVGVAPYRRAHELLRRYGKY